YDHHHRDPIAYRVLGLPKDLMVTRRWFYLIPAEGEPAKLVHKIEAGHLDSLPGGKRQYSGWQELFDSLKAMLASHRDIAMQYSPNNIVFTISLVDAGTVELLRGLGKNVVSSADLVAQFEATWSDEQIKSHFAARDSVDAIVAEAFREIGRRARNGGTTEHEIQQWFMEAFRRENLIADDGPIVRFPFARATSSCLTCGGRRILRGRFTMTLPGWVFWVRLHRAAWSKCSR